MANTSRRYIDKTGKMFVPMNVEGGSWNEHFITTPKLVCIAIMLASAVLIGMSLKEAYSPLSSYIIFYGLWALVCFYALRFIVFEEKFYYRMYKQLKQSEITTPSIFWDIASIKDNNDGAILTYSDAKIGVIIRLERDTITGKPPEFVETHYDAISDFYREIMLRKYNFVQMNIMEQAGNDPRLEELDKLIYSSDNGNVRKLMEWEIGYIKNITHHTLYESDYILFYTSDLSKIDTIVNDAIDIVYKILDGAYIGYRVLRARDIIEFMKEEYGVKYFNYTEATLAMFKSHGVNTKNPFELSKIIYADGDVQNITSREINKINKMASDILNGTLDSATLSLKEALYPKKQQNRGKKVEFGTLSEGFGPTQGGQQTKRNIQFEKQQRHNTELPQQPIIQDADQEWSDLDFELDGTSLDDGFDIGVQDNQNQIDLTKKQSSAKDEDDDFIDF